MEFTGKIIAILLSLIHISYKFYCGKNLEDAHTAEADTRATYEVLMSQLDCYPELQNDVAFLADYSSFNKNVDFAGRMVYDDKGVEVFNFGKYKGCLLYTSCKGRGRYFLCPIMTVTLR